MVYCSLCVSAMATTYLTYLLGTVLLVAGIMLTPPHRDTIINLPRGSKVHRQSQMTKRDHTFPWEIACLPNSTSMSVMQVLLLAFFLAIVQRCFNWLIAVPCTWLGDKFSRASRAEIPHPEVETERRGDGSQNRASGMRNEVMRYQVYGPRKFYAVRRGYNPGLYFSWPDCQAQVSGFSNAEFRSFRFQEEAERYLKRC